MGAGSAAVRSALREGDHIRLVAARVACLIRRARSPRAAAASACLAALALGASLWAILPHRWDLVPSPNCDDRPPGAQVRCIVLHATAIPSRAQTIARFRDPASKVSAHFVVDKDGSIVQLVPVEKRAWHAGMSEWAGQPNVNDFSIGIEMVNRNDGADPYPEAQVRAVAEIIRVLRHRYDIPLSGVVTHAEIARPQGRKTDPLGFDLARLRALCR